MDVWRDGRHWREKESKATAEWMMQRSSGDSGQQTTAAAVGPVTFWDQDAGASQVYSYCKQLSSSLLPIYLPLPVLQEPLRQALRSLM